MGGPEIDRLIALLSRLPGLGPRSARRTALKLLQEPETRLLPLAQAMQDAARSVRACSACGNLDSTDPCQVCTDPHRDRGLVCVVESVGDLWALERAHVHRGTYHVLGGTLSPLAGIGPEDLNIAPPLAWPKTQTAPKVAELAMITKKIPNRIIRGIFRFMSNDPAGLAR